ncbi:MAG: sugar kinase [Lachnospiraceae bacterium]|jgi:2-dehydro-3-deoxygluconokinase|nr:sugar kinase [Lachnospiraceae bacterium]MDD3616974.1 sugar kinase [Lachnospiraceae bacterium]
MKEFDLLSLGEILLRLSSSNNERMARSETFDKQVGGAELNVLSGVSLLGLRTGIISKIPDNDMGKYAKNRVRFVGVSDDYLVYDQEKDARLGVYYYENGAYPRKPKIVYDRLHTSMRKIHESEFPDSMFSAAKCFHTTGITLALCPNCKNAVIDMMKKFKAQGTLISFDVNFRSNLWTGEEARKTIEEILPLVDIFFCSEDTARLTFHKEGDVKEIMKSFTQDYPISIVAATQRIVHSPKVHTFGSIIYESKTDSYYEEDPYANIEVVDRIGSGDAYISGVLYGLLKYDGDCQKALEYGNATGAVKNTIPGDMQASGCDEIEQVILAHQSTGKELEMVR